MGRSISATHDVEAGKLYQKYTDLQYYVYQKSPRGGFLVRDKPDSVRAETRDGYIPRMTVANHLMQLSEHCSTPIMIDAQ